ncbi:MAG: phage tail protein I [Myxococcota bacterium]
MSLGTIRQLRVPDLIGLTAQNAALVLESAGFPAPDIKYAESYEPRLTVIAQSPPARQIKDSTTVINITVSQRNMIRQLPAIYQKDQPDGSNLLRNFLWVFQHVVDSINDTIDDVHNVFDPYETPEEFLPWLASWLAFTIDDNWEVEKKRHLIKKAMEFYRIRGTLKGLELWLELFTGVTPDIRENEWPFRGFQIGVNSTIGIDSIILPPVNKAHCFVVDFPIDPDEVTDELIFRIHDVIQAQKPAHATYFLQFKGERKAMSTFGIVIGEHAVGAGMEVVELDEEEDEDGSDFDIGI